MAGSSGTEIDLSWSKSDGVVSYYQIEEHSDADAEGEWNVLGCTSGSGDSQVGYSASVTAGGNSYSFRVMGVNSGGESPYAGPTEPIQTPNTAPHISGISAISGVSAGGDVTGTGATLAADVSDDGDSPGQSDLTYDWSVTSPASGGDAWFDDDTAAEPSLHFTKAGDYTVTLTVTDSQGVSTTLDPPLDVTVVQTLSSIVLSPDAATLFFGESQQFAAAGIDQFGDDMTATGLEWSIQSGDGSVSQTGLYAAPTSGTPGVAEICASAPSESSMNAMSQAVLAAVYNGLPRLMPPSPSAATIRSRTSSTSRPATTTRKR